MRPAPTPLPLAAQAVAVPAFAGVLDFCSNFHPSPVFGYPTVEAAYQAAKTTDPAVRARIRAAPAPAQAKRLGRGLALRPGWEEMKLDVMRTLVREKFSRHPALAERLLATGDVELVERNYWRDSFWGVCGGRGENHLGCILMDLRAELRARGGLAPPPPRRG
ncbi:MAG TPA: NADAR family protein [Longimicrobiaceae bacterium]|nr:NADAR family protein [Longimicrobiaceae bacterium]